MKNPDLPGIDKRWIWMGLGVLTFLLKALFAANPYFTEVVYARGLFVLIRYVWDYTLGWSPLPWLWVLVAVLLSVIGYKGVKGVRSRKNVPVAGTSRSFLQKTGHMLLSLAAWASAAVFFFFMLWGFNYHRRPIEEQLELKVTRLDSAAIDAEFAYATDLLREARAEISATDTAALSKAALPASLENDMREALSATLQEMDYPTPGRVRARILQPQGFLLRFGASGIYIPYVLEGHIDAAMPAASIPFTLAHEMGHGYGFGDEGTCNFLALLACERSANPVIRYSGRLAYWRYAASAWRQFHPQDYVAFRKTLPLAVQADLDALRNALLKYPGFFPKASNQIYNQYLRSQGIREGTANYDKIVPLSRAWRSRKVEE